MNAMNWKQLVLILVKLGLLQPSGYKSIWATLKKVSIVFKNAYCMQVAHGWYIGLSCSDVNIFVYIFFNSSNY